MKKKKIIALLLVSAMTVGLMAGCGKAEEDKSDGGNGGEVVRLKIHNMIPEQADQKEVMEKVNEYTREKIGVEVDYVFHGGSYADKIQVIIASGEEYDACFTSNWLNPFNTNVAKGAFLDIKDMLPEVAPKLYETLPEAFWEAATVKGGIYAVPNQQIAARQMVGEMPKEYADAAGVTADDIHNLVDCKDYAQYALDKFGAKVGGVAFAQAAEYSGYEYISDYAAAGVIKMGDDSAKVVNYYDTDEWRELIKESIALNEAGLLDGQCAYDAEYKENQRIAKKVSINFGGTYKPGGEIEATQRNGWEAVNARINVEPLMSTNSIIATMYAVSATSKHPEETLKYLELVNTDPYLMNLLSYGIEGKHYEKVSDNVIAPIPDSGYSHGQSWALGNVFNTYVLEGMPDDVWEQTAELNDSAKRSVLLGFSFDPEPVKMQIANVSNVVKEFSSLVGGELPVEKNDEFVEKLKVAGVDEVIAEMQKQVDEFMASK